MFLSSSTIGKSAASGIQRGTRVNKRPKVATPPSWYQKHALMYGHYEGENRPSSLAPSRQCNVQEKVLYSMILDKKVKFKVSTVALEMMDKMGGLDVYIMHTDTSSLGGDKSVGAVFKKMLQDELTRKRGEDPELLGKEIVYRCPDEKLSWQAALNPDFWKQNRV